MGGMTESLDDRYIFVHRIDKRSPVEKSIPLHMTAFHWFKSEADPQEIADRLQRVLQSTKVITTHATTEDMFGSDYDIPVMRLKRTPELLDLHLELLDLVQDIKGDLDTRWVGEEKWSPHVTHVPGIRLYPGDTVHIADVDLIAGKPDGSRELIVTVSLGAE